MTKNLFFALSLGLGGVILATQYANAQQRQSCADRAIVVARLHDQYGESRQSIGLGQNNAVMEVFASPDTGTWTILVSLPSGQSCLVASGQSWERLAEDAPAPGSDA